MTTGLKGSLFESFSPFHPLSPIPPVLSTIPLPHPLPQKIQPNRPPPPFIPPARGPNRTVIEPSPPRARPAPDLQRQRRRSPCTTKPHFPIPSTQYIAHHRFRPNLRILTMRERITHGILRQEPHIRPREFARIQTPLGQTGPPLLMVRMEVAVHAACLEVDDVHVKRLQLEAHVRAEHGGGGLRRVVDRVMWRGLDARDGGVVDDHAGRARRSGAGHEEREECLRHDDGRPHVQVEERFGFRERDVRHGHVVAWGGDSVSVVVIGDLWAGLGERTPLLKRPDWRLLASWWLGPTSFPSRPQAHLLD